MVDPQFSIDCTQGGHIGDGVSSRYVLPTLASPRGGQNMLSDAWRCVPSVSVQCEYETCLRDEPFLRSSSCYVGPQEMAGNVDAAQPSRPVSELEHIRRGVLAAVAADDAPLVLEFFADGIPTALLAEVLCSAVQKGSFTVVQELVATGISVNDECPVSGFAPLHLACAGANPFLCEMLLEAMADVNLLSRGSSPIDIARRSREPLVESVVRAYLSEDPSAAPPQPSKRHTKLLPRVAPSFFAAGMTTATAPVKDL